ncbi:S8 family serine peptidase [Micromonospora sp. WMMD1102]|uniref:S8 family serine peptidase n=1 Tax=Micromonospora sp. WMMD1102 TaxID=3016105 RepID=UPI00241594BA|nr:S8 family serine peptidase [Micromonospora sp. WMMD1102]MDG4791654.1 S8 family serine peptidase [Micromonospora sp. WMMD1102]
MVVSLGFPAVTSTPAQAAPKGQDAAQSGGPGEQPQQVTLVTGDRVDLTRAANGGYTVDVEPAPRRDGTPVTFLTDAGPDGVFVLPSDALPAIWAGQLDRGLFHVSYLVEHGYADADSDALPVIVTYPKPAAAGARGAAPTAASLAARAAKLPGTVRPVGLTSISGAGVKVPKAEAGAFWQSLRSGGTAKARSGADAPGLTAEVSKVWLDGRADLVLDETVPLIGAPQAWAAGYDGSGVTVAVLDSGADLNHPDLTGRIAAAESFVDGLPPQDQHGHGTHVASTIAGTGAASEGRYKGVAPGAKLVTGRVCNNGGSCEYSDMIAGMEWAARQMKADVVSMSLSGPATDGTDPLSLAVNELTASTGALFVIAAGNKGADLTVGSPAAADASLAVAATDKSDGLATFSSRGPRIGDLALKPDIAAPGVDIAAARAAGTTMGEPVDDWYTVADGTSMATPHVSGAAAVLAQRHPEWQAGDLKAALMSAAKDTAHTVYQQGAGRLDVARVVTQQVYATTPNVDFRNMPLPGAGQPQPAPVTREVTYRNLSDQPVTLSLAPNLAAAGGTAPPAGVLTVAETVTVPAGGTASTTVTLDVAKLGEGRFTGAVVATAGATRVTTPVGVTREPPRYTLTIRTLGRDGQPASPWAQDTIRLDGPKPGPVPGVQLSEPGVTVTQVPPGTYHINQTVNWVDADSRMNTALLGQPELVVTGNTEITLDLRKAQKVTFSTPRPAEPLNSDIAISNQRSAPTGQTFSATLGAGANTGLWALPTDNVSVGKFRFATQALLGQAPTTLAVLGAGPTLHPVTPRHTMERDQVHQGGLIPVQDGFPGWTPFTGIHDLKLVDAGTGAPEELVGLAVKGNLALLEAAAVYASPFGGLTCGVDILRLRALRDAGAAGVVVFPAGDAAGCGRPYIPVPVVKEPFTALQSLGVANVHLPRREGLQLRDRLAAGQLTLRVQGRPETGYTYALKPYSDGRVPDSLHFRFTGSQQAQLGQVSLDFHAPSSPTTTFEDYHSVFKLDDMVTTPLALSAGGSVAFVGPRSRTEYFGPVSRTVLHYRNVGGRIGGIAPEGQDNRFTRISPPTLFVQPAQSREVWRAVPLAPGASNPSPEVLRLFGPGALQELGQCTFCRQAGYLFTYFRLFTAGAAGGQGEGNGTSADREENFRDFDVRLFRDGTEIQPVPGLPWDLFPVPAEPAKYRMTAQGKKTDVTWTFSSAEPVRDTRQPGFPCFPEVVMGRTGPCAQEQVLFANYDLSGSLTSDNTVLAPGVQTFTVHAYHAPSTAPMPSIAGLNLSYSYDGGKRWVPTVALPVGNGKYKIVILHPADRFRPSDQVSLKVVAWDKAGNRIEQVTQDAFTLRDRILSGPRDKGV